MTVHLIHGFNVSDGGKDTIRRLEPFIAGSEISHDTGWAGLFSLRFSNADAVKQVQSKIKKGDILVGHSNAAWIIWQIAQTHGYLLGGIVLINPALRRDTVWAPFLPVLSLNNSTDWVVLLGRFWSRLVSLGGIHPHGWGAAGRYGFNQGYIKDSHVSNIDTAEAWWSEPTKGHSGVFMGDAPAFWGGVINDWIKFENRYK